MQSKILIAIGHKARQGKDTFANIWKKIDPENVYITHWADPLKIEAQNNRRNVPLISKEVLNGKTFYNLLDTQTSVLRKSEEEVPYLHKIFTERGITEYVGMNEKDPQILQFWGTDFRRKQYDNYWVDRTLEHIDTISKKFILIPDTRFKNEYNAVKNLNGYYVKIIRLHKDDTQYLDVNRDPRHLSEIDLEYVSADFTIAAYDEDLESFKLSAIAVINSINFLCS